MALVRASFTFLFRAANHLRYEALLAFIDAFSAFLVISSPYGFSSMKNAHSSFSLLLSLGNLQHLRFLCGDLVRFSVKSTSLANLFCSLMSQYTLNP